MRAPGNVSIRGVDSRDTPAVVDLFRHTAKRDPTVTPITATDWHRFLSREENGGGEGFLVAELPGRLAGVATSSLRRLPEERIRHFRIVVEPASRRSGVGTALLAAVLTLDGEPPPVILQCLCSSDSSTARGFLEPFGFSVVETEIEMGRGRGGISLSVRTQAVEVGRIEKPAGLAAEVARLHNQAYARDVSFVEFTAEGMARLLADGADLYVARAPDGEILGYCHCEPGRSTTWIESLVVAPGARERGIGSALMARAIADAEGRGQAAKLAVSDRNVAALRIYSRFGFEPVARSLRYRANSPIVRNRVEMVL